MDGTAFLSKVRLKIKMVIMLDFMHQLSKSYIDLYL